MRQRTDRDRGLPPLLRRGARRIELLALGTLVAFLGSLAVLGANLPAWGVGGMRRFMAVWAVAIGLIVIVFVAYCVVAVGRVRASRRHGYALCQQCAYPLVGLAESGNCPECAEPYDIERTRLRWRAADRTRGNTPAILHRAARREAVAILLVVAAAFAGSWYAMSARSSWRGVDLATVTIYGGAVLVSALVLVQQVRLFRRLRHAKGQGCAVCEHCMYPLEGLGDAGECPGCSAAFELGPTRERWEAACARSSVLAWLERWGRG